ncbi:type III pantothenate kinase [Candidatus Aminicenantes bacterium AC-335-A11]|nr:type III pantothenate kinase [SCandidatus Aminicenantes bacterium Aminicenantia_JdfR_composite]MCP2598645.1 type III pantothenate kinase [Candidatus Aminicenantes bacterium AC-335-L06]MCP2618536.1 type III pantothenate kinase [Candidatus Aminicenantes bacterium AC-335-A11]
MLLAIDIGNTNIVFGVFKKKKLITHWRIFTEKNKTADEYGILLMSLFRLSNINPSSITGIIISCVVPPLTGIFTQMSEKYFNLTPLIVAPGIKTGLAILYDNPHEVGADRIVNSVAAYHKYGGPCIVVDFGTATTFDAISAKGEYLGGAIAPGLYISAEALSEKTAKLPRVEIKKPKNVIGKTTVASIQSGLYFGYIGLIEKIIFHMKRELGEQTKVISTGGITDEITRQIKIIDYQDPYLTLEGLRIIYERNQ